MRLRVVLALLALLAAGGTQAQPRLIAIANFGEHPALQEALGWNGS